MKKRKRLVKKDINPGDYFRSKQSGEIWIVGTNKKNKLVTMWIKGELGRVECEYTMEDIKLCFFRVHIKE